MSLEKRRLLTDVTFLYKVNAGNIRFSLKSKDFLTLKKKYARTNVLKYSFFHWIIDMWNQLPFDNHYSDNVNIFKSRVKKFISDS